MWHQHEPVNAPSSWSSEERRLAQTIDKLFDEVYRKIGDYQKRIEYLESLLKISEKESGMGFQQIKARGDMVTEVDEFMIESSDDLSNLPSTAAPGSIAYTADMSYVAQKDINNTWATILEPAEVEDDG